MTNTPTQAMNDKEVEPPNDSSLGTDTEPTQNIERRTGGDGPIADLSPGLSNGWPDISGGESTPDNVPSAVSAPSSEQMPTSDEFCDELPTKADNNQASRGKTLKTEPPPISYYGLQLGLTQSINHEERPPCAENQTTACSGGELPNGNGNGANSSATVAEDAAVGIVMRRQSIPGAFFVPGPGIRQTADTPDNDDLSDNEILVQAEPVGNQNATVVPYAIAEYEGKKMATKRCAGAIVTVLAIIVGLTTALLITNNSKSSPKEPVSEAAQIPSLKPIEMPSSIPAVYLSERPTISEKPTTSTMPTTLICKISSNQRKSDLIDRLSTISDPTAFDNTMSPQSRALKWMIEEDGFFVCPQDDEVVQRYVMAVLFLSVVKLSSSISASRLDDSHVCDWNLVDLDLYCSGGVVTGILLKRGANLGGSLPSEIARLTSLRHITTENDQITGHIPSELGMLPNIEKIWFDNTKLSGPIPSELGRLRSLQDLSLAANHLTGTVPSELGNLSNLGESMRLFMNQLTGPIPTELGQLQEVKVLLLSENRLSGQIPSEIGRLKNLQVIDLYKNQLAQKIPSELGQLRSLRQLSLTENHLTGSIPSQLGRLSNLEYLTLDKNILTGTIPRELVDLSQLDDLKLSTNLLTGPIPTEFGQFEELRVLRLENNLLSSTIPSELGSLKKVQNVWISSNELNGTIPTELGQLKAMTSLRLCNNFLTGTVPSELGSLPHIDQLSLFSNQLNGSVPGEMCNRLMTELVIDCSDSSGPNHVSCSCCTSCNNVFCGDFQF